MCEPTICAKCEHRIDVRAGLKLWQHDRCAATAVRYLPTRDRVTGKMVQRETDYQWCENVNDGNCPFFKPRRGWWERLRDRIIAGLAEKERL